MYLVADPTSGDPQRRAELALADDAGQQRAYARLCLVQPDPRGHRVHAPPLRRGFVDGRRLHGGPPLRPCPCPCPCRCCCRRRPPSCNVSSSSSGGGGVPRDERDERAQRDEQSPHRQHGRQRRQHSGSTERQREREGAKRGRERAMRDRGSAMRAAVRAAIGPRPGQRALQCAQRLTEKG